MRVRTHPGEILRHEYLDPLEMSGTELAKRIDVPANRITDIIRGRRDVTADTALRLGEFFDTTPEFWMNLQTAHNLSKAQAERAVVRADVRGGQREHVQLSVKAYGVPGLSLRAKSAAASSLKQKGADAKSSSAVVSKAARVLKDPAASKAAKSLAASALTEKSSMKSSAVKVAKRQRKA